MLERYMKIVDTACCKVADSHGTYGKLNMRTSCHAALITRKCSCGLSSAELVASGS
jgi:hypothetical protein